MSGSPIFLRLTVLWLTGTAVLRPLPSAGQETAPEAPAAAPAPAPAAEALPASPAKLFAGLAKDTPRPQWRAYFRETVPRTTGDRFKAALSLGALCADCYLAAEARDGQQVVNLLTDMAALETALSISRRAAGTRLKFIELAEAGDWSGVRAEIAGLMTVHAQALEAQQDQLLAELERTGCWLRAFQIGALYSSRQTKMPAQPCIWSLALLDGVRTRTAKATEGHAAKTLQTLTGGLDSLHKIWTDPAAPDARLAATLKTLDVLMADLIGEAAPTRASTP